MLPVARSVSDPAQHDAGYERNVIILMSLGFGLVGLDRTIIYPLFPVLSAELGLNYQDIGNISAILALTWGASALVSGRLSDRLGEKAILVPATIAFSLLVLLTGFANSILTLLIVRALMGFAEGLFAPASIVITVRASRPERIGLNTGLQQMAAPFFGFLVAPLLATFLLTTVKDWHLVFFVVSIPGLLLAAAMAKILKGRRQNGTTGTAPEKPEVITRAPPEPSDGVLKYRNAVVAIIGVTIWLSSLTALATLLPNLLTDHMGLNIPSMGIVLAGQGVGSVAGVLLIPALSDKMGTKIMVVACAILEVVSLAAFQYAPINVPLLFVLLCLISGANAGVIATLLGPLINKSVPKSLANTATGMAMGIGEIIGGAGAPFLAGFIAHHYGIEKIPGAILALLVVGTVVMIIGLKPPEHSKQTVEPEVKLC
ncbi:major facilitator transporter [Hyphomonas adhaerens MHS-3]|uniref:Major facilitator transporter n=1 Tax=Hyphomonas adhaerens MHS-3 TaxID=1280949 RepID=A0A069E7F8_9PROT|nr:MFS transporter [Hyphomonas adhaerens]KCZ86007.1 major facilitator transporter [Hyphomonas adhaerens MHS-3]